MFEDRKRRKTKKMLLALFIVFVVGAFSLGYYLNVDFEDSSSSGDEINYQIPDEFINPNTLIDDDKPKETTEELINIISNDRVTPNSTLIFKTYYSKCDHYNEKKSIPTAEEINMDENALKLRYQDWELGSFSLENIVFNRVIDAYCTNHYIIGIYGGNIAVFQYDEDGEKILKEETEISIAIFTPEDQKALQDGIVADSEEELYLKIEGFSN